MRYHILLIGSFITALPLCLAGFANGQCANGKCVQPVGRNNGTGYPTVNHPQNIQSVFETNPVFPQFGIDPGSLGAGQTLDPGLGSADRRSGSEGPASVYIIHPLTGDDVMVRSFEVRTEAEQFRQQLAQRFWIVYENSSGKKAFREARSAEAINSLVGEIRSAGNQIQTIDKVVARIGGDETSLESLLGMGQAEQRQVVTEAKPAEPPTDPELAALEGLWTAVARTASGQLGTIELKLDSGGWAQLSLPNESGEATTVERQALVEDGVLKLRDGDREFIFGKLANVDSNQFVLSRNDSQITFLKK